MIGTRLAHYEITSHLGTGGMGEVYQATDSKLGRRVAIKLLPEAFTHDTERASRFEREARVLASLNHPNIAAIYEVAESGGRRFLVMELVPGETLGEKLTRGAIPVEETLRIAVQITEALEAAHEKGIIHRDLKPANIKITPSGNVKVLDFGLAKVREAEGAALSKAPTKVTASAPGMIIGTAAYMSPEQAKGVDTDRTSDVWAFGCVFYEMLTGHRVFEGETVSEILAAVLKSDPDWNRLPAGTPERIRRLLRRCLQREEKRRLRDFRDARIEIEEAEIGPQVGAPGGASRRRGRLAWISSLAVIVLIAAVAIVSAFHPAPLSLEMRLEITQPPTTDSASLAISPDARKIVFAATTEAGSQLWLRSMDSVSARPLAGADNATYPFWSPDSRSVGFFADGKLKRIDIDGGVAQTLADAPLGRGGTWNSDGVILFVPAAFVTSNVSAIFRTSATGAEAVPAMPLQPRQLQAVRFPQFLPDGHHFLYYVYSNDEARGVHIGQIGESATQRLLDADAPAVYTSSGQLLFVRQGTLFAQNFDPVRLALSGNPVPIAEHVAVDAALPLAALSASAAGPIVYRRTSIGGGQRQLAWFDRSGKEIEKEGEPEADNAAPASPSMSPDGRRAALHRVVNGNFDIWLLEMGKGLLQRFTTHTALDVYPIWSPDGSRVVFNSNRNGVFDLYEKPATGSGNEQLLLATPQAKTAMDWSPDGRFILYRSLDPKTGYDLWALPMDGDRKAFPVVQTNFEESDGQFSPDGKWIAYQSNETSRVEIYIQPFSNPGSRKLISPSGGAQVRWGRDSKELFYIALDGRLMAVSLRLASDGKSLDADKPVPLFATRVGGALQGVNRQQYIVSPDGQRFLMNAITEQATPITVILNWKPKP